MAKSTAEKDLEKEIENKIKSKFDNWGKSNKSKSGNSGGAGALYFAGFIGSTIYWFQVAVGFGAFVTGILKAAVWPAYVAYKLLEIFYGAA